MERKLTAILAADIVGYSQLMGEDYNRARDALRQLREQLFDPIVAAHRGNVVKRLGDGWIVEFSSISDAVACAITIQTGLADHDTIRLRMGLHTGEVVFEAEDVFGDGVNVAARLEGLAEPAQVLISDTAYNSLDRKTARQFSGGDVRPLKNIDRDVRVWHWSSRTTGIPDKSHTGATTPERPAVAILPFDNMSGDPEQQYFSDGLTEDIITALSKHRWLDVVARNTTFAYKGKSPNIQSLADELGVQYVVEGSVRKSGQRIRVTAQLIDTGSGNHIWAERYDRELEDIFDLQDEITEIVVGRLEPQIGTVVRQQVERKSRPTLRAWDCFHLGIARFYQFTAEGNREAQRLLNQSRTVDPEFSEAHAWWAYATILGMVYWDTEPDTAIMDEALAAVRKAISLDTQNALLYMLAGRVQLARREYQSAISENETAIRMNPTLAQAYCGLGDSLAYEGRYDEAIAQFEKAVAMSPNHPQLWAFLSYGALTLLFAGRSEDALMWAKRARNIPNCQYWATAHAVVALAALDSDEEQASMVRQLLAEQPDFTISFADKKLFYLKRSEQRQLYLDGLRKAGLPEE
ncbi:MAG: adenylate/guanylate cyclase domain-containing protein [Hyphomicrobiaceae bacterium]